MLMNWRRRPEGEAVGGRDEPEGQGGDDDDHVHGIDFAQFGQAVDDRHEHDDCRDGLL